MRYIVLSLMLLAACGERESDLDSFEPTYSSHVRPIYDRYCHQCHAEAGVKAGGVELDRYRTAAATAKKSVCTAVTQTLVDEWSPRVDLSPSSGGAPCAGWEVFSMPTGAKSRLTNTEQRLLLRWLEIGVPE